MVSAIAPTALLVPLRAVEITAASAPSMPAYRIDAFRESVAARPRDRPHLPLQRPVRTRRRCAKGRRRTFFMTLDFSHYLLIIVGAVLVNNVVLVRILGLCPFMGVSKKLDAAIGMGAATAFVLTLASGASHLLNLLLLAAGLEYLRTIAFIVVIAAIVQFTEMVIHKTSPVLYQALGIYLPLITTNW